MPKILIFGTSYVKGQLGRYRFNLWAELVRRLNPGRDVLVVDSDSPDMPHHEFETLQIGDNIGHMVSTGRDGWGRAFCAGLNYAAIRGYEWVAHVETDLLFARSVVPEIEYLAYHKIPIAAPMAAPFPWIETALMFVNVAWTREFGFNRRYDWETTPASPIPEQRIMNMVGSEFGCLPLRGMRNDMKNKHTDIRRMFPYGIDWITHAEPAVLRQFLVMNKMEDVG